MQKELDNEKEQMIQKYIDTPNRSDIVEEIIPNILYGRVDNLFLNCREYLWGKLEVGNSVIWNVLNFDNWNLNIPPAVGQVFVI